MNGTIREVYTDSFEHTFDDKGRITVPSEWRSDAHENRLHIMASKEGCLRVYPASFLSEKMQKLADAPFDDPRRKKLEAFARNVQSVECDSQGRMMVRSSLRESASLKKYAVLLGCMNHFEIWDRETWQAHQHQTQTFEDIAAEVGL